MCVALAGFLRALFLWQRRTLPNSLRRILPNLLRWEHSVALLDWGLYGNGRVLRAPCIKKRCYHLNLQCLRKTCSPQSAILPPAPCQHLLACYWKHLWYLMEVCVYVFGHHFSCILILFLVHGWCGFVGSAFGTPVIPYFLSLLIGPHATPESLKRHKSANCFSISL